MVELKTEIEVEAMAAAGAARAARTEHTVAVTHDGARIPTTQG